MNPQAKKRLIYGVIIVILICFGLFLYFNHTESVVPAQKAQLHTETYDVGASYSGQIAKQFVQEGDEVKAGETLFYIDSATLKTQMQEPGFNSTSLGVPLTTNGDMVITATKPGTVKTIASSQGSFVPANTVLATIAQPDNLRVVADFRLSPYQYSKIDKKSLISVTLPNGQVVTTPIENINIINQGNEMVAEITGSLDKVKYDPLTTRDGAPVSARLVVEEPMWEKITSSLGAAVKGLF